VIANGGSTEVAKQVADLITLARGFLVVIIPWLGITQGSASLPWAADLIAADWTGDVLDGALAKRAAIKQQTWVGAHNPCAFDSKHWQDSFRTIHPEGEASTHQVWGGKLRRKPLDTIFLQNRAAAWQIVGSQHLTITPLAHSDHKAVLTQLQHIPLDAHPIPLN
jgi:hypothetical protein